MGEREAGKKKNVDGRNWLHWKLGTESNVVDHIMWVQIYLLGTCPLKAPSSLSSDNAWQGPKLSLYFQKLKERIPAKLGNFHLLPCKYVSYIFQREREREEKKLYIKYSYKQIYINSALIVYMCIDGVPCSYSILNVSLNLYVLQYINFGFWYFTTKKLCHGFP